MNIQNYKGTSYLERDTSLPTLSGSAKSEIGKLDSVAILVVGGMIFELPIDPVTGAYSWTATDPLPDGNYSVSITIKDRAGNAGKPALATLVVDTTPPKAPELINLYDDQGANTGSFDAGKATDDKRPELTGIAEKGVMVYLQDASGKTIGSAQADKITGKWVIVPSEDLNSGTNSLTLVAEQTFAGTTRTGTPSAAFNIVVGATGNLLQLNNDPPAAEPVAAHTQAITPLAYNPTSYLERDTALPTLGGTAKSEIGKTGSVALLVVGGLTVELPIDPVTGAYTWTATDPLPDGDYSVSIVIKDRAGNIGKPALVTLRIDTTPPEAPELLNLYDDQGAITGSFDAGKTTDDKRPQLTGIAQPGTLVYLHDASGKTLGSAMADRTSGKWVIIPSEDLKDGNNDLTLTAEETFAGKLREGSASPVFTIVIGADKSLDPTIDHAYDNAGADQGNRLSGATTDDTTPTLHGTGDPSASINLRYRNGSGNYITTVVNADAFGKWNWTPASALAKGNWTFEVLDAEGNVSGSGFSLTIDPTFDRVTSITSIYDDVGTAGYISNGGSTDDNRPTLSGIAKANTVINIYDNNALIGSTTTNANGDWSWTPSSALAVGIHRFNAAHVSNGSVGAKSAYWNISITPAASSGVDEFSYDHLHFVEGTTYNLASGASLVMNKLGWPGDGSSSGYYNSNGSKVLCVNLNSIVTITIPSPTDKLEFSVRQYGWTNSYASTGTVKLLDSSKKIIDIINISDSEPNYGYGSVVNYSFTSKNVNVKFIEISTTSGLANEIDWMKWGNGVNSTYNASPTNYNTNDEVILLHSLEEKNIPLSTKYILEGEDSNIYASEILLNHQSIDISGKGDNSLIFDAITLQQHGEKNTFISDDKIQMIINGDKGDLIKLTDMPPEFMKISEWQHQPGLLTIAGLEYQVYSNGEAELLVQAGVKVEVPNSIGVELNEVLAQDETILLLEDEHNEVDNESAQHDVLQLADVLPENEQLDAWEQQTGKINNVGVAAQEQVTDNNALGIIESEVIKNELI